MEILGFHITEMTEPILKAVHGIVLIIGFAVSKFHPEIYAVHYH